MYSTKCLIQALLRMLGANQTDTKSPAIPPRTATEPIVRTESI